MMGPGEASARFWLREAAGALGDFGRFVPLAVGIPIAAQLMKARRGDKPVNGSVR